MPEYGNLVDYIVRRLVDQPDEVKVTETRNEAGAVLVTIDVAQGDIGRIIGKRGSTINAIRLVTKAAAVKSGDKVDVDVDED